MIVIISAYNTVQGLNRYVQPQTRLQPGNAIRVVGNCITTHLPEPPPTRQALLLFPSVCISDWILFFPLFRATSRRRGITAFQKTSSPGVELNFQLTMTKSTSISWRNLFYAFLTVLWFNRERPVLRISFYILEHKTFLRFVLTTLKRNKKYINLRLSLKSNGISSLFWK